MSYRSTIFYFLVAFIVQTSAFAANVEGVRIWRAPDHTRLVFDLSGKVEHNIFSLSAPDRLVIDVQSTKMIANLTGLDLTGTPINKLRHGVRESNDLRVVLDLNEKIKPRSFVLKKHAGKPDRLVIDLYDKAKETIKTVAKATKSAANKNRDIVIVIDAGHGGEDPGAIGPKRIYEKDVVLKLSRSLERLVNAEPGF